MKQKINHYTEKALLAIFVFAFGIWSYGQSPPPPPEYSGGGGVGPGARPKSPVDMYIPFLIAIAVIFIALYAYRRKQLVK